MSNIINSIKLDYYILKSNFKIILIVVFLSTFIGIMTSNPPVIMYIISIYSANFLGTIFSIYEKNKLNKLYGILPLGKHQVVIGRYLFTLAVGVLNGVMAIVLTLIVLYFRNINISNLAFISYLSSSVLLFCVFISVQFPLYFKYEYSKITAVAILPPVILFIIGITLFKKNAELFSPIIKYFIQNQNMIWLIGICAGLILLCISCVLSCVIYKNREL